MTKQALRIIDIVFFSMLQGVLEWLPVSSSGQVMILLTKIMNFSLIDAYRLSLALHLGSGLAAMICYTDELRKSFWSLMRRELDENMKIMLVPTMTSLPIAYLVYAMYSSLIPATSHEWGMLLVGVLLVVTGLFMLTARWIRMRCRDRVAKKDLILIGIVQGFTVLPGLSRSGVTTSVLMILGYPPSLALKVSFLMAIPVLLLASLYQLTTGEYMEPLQLMMSCITCALMGVMTMKSMIKLAKRAPIHYFVIAYGVLTVILNVFAYI
ncbi:MAG: hypothetical protein DRN15_05490 [Thermoprotei archaeon]|nr:MAG: hypothetical protein DRM97_05655 [Thermoprotei archaeon]RLF23635.1 MAG: hypothetical protein DRN15_05490 [Thermoprotei archaeon]